MRRWTPRQHAPRPRRREPREGAGSGRERTTRLLGRVEWQHGTMFFAAAARIRRGRRPLVVGRQAAPEAGDYVIADCPFDQTKAYLIEVLGREDDPRWDNLAVLSRHRWPTRFSDEALREAAAAPLPERPGAEREDFRDRICFTMDPVDAADFDDALSWRDLGGGRCEVGIHVADVSFYVRPDTALDREARERATSVYLAGQAVPMLPDRLSSNLCSLVPDRDRFVLSVIAEMDEHGGVHRYRLAEGVIRSRARLSYEQGAAALATAGALAPDVDRALRALAGIARALLARRVQRGAIDLDTQEVKAVVAPDGRTLALERKERLETHRVVEEFMLLANTLVGEEAERRGEEFLFRVHEPPPTSKLAALSKQLRALALPSVAGDDPGGRALQRLLAVPLPPEKKRLVAQLVLRSMARAGYRETDAGHFGLATRAYCHFTSPIRRYPDLFNHRQVRHWLREPRGRAGRFAWQRQIDNERRALEETFPEGFAGLARHTTDQEWTAQEAERESVRVKALRFMESFLGEEYDGTIVGVVERGIFVELDAHPVEGFVRVADAVDDDFRLDEAGVRLVGRRTRRRFTLGDRVRVALARIDVPARELELTLVAPRPRPAGGRRARAQRRSGGLHR